jgi:hypothetical protein
MPNDPELPSRFAKIIIAELATIHALTLNLHDHMILEIAKESNCSTEKAADALNKKLRKRTDEIADDLLARLRLKS